jgi:hypothetical protein
MADLYYYNVSIKGLDIKHINLEVPFSTVEKFVAALVSAQLLAVISVRSYGTPERRDVRVITARESIAVGPDSFNFIKVATVNFVESKTAGKG